jgi:hypothetical protein
MMAGLHILRCFWISLALFWLAGCGPTSFSQMAADSTFRQAPPILLVGLNQMPAPVGAQFALLLRDAAARRGMKVITGDFVQGVRISGFFTSFPEGGDRVIGYDWQVTDPAGLQLQHITGEERAPDGDAFPQDVLARIAEATAENLASRMLQLGFSTRAAGMPPPPDAFLTAGPGAERDIDYETLYGPQGSPQKVETAPLTAAPPQKAVDKPGVAIRSVAVLEVTGAPGTGNAELRRAMKQVLSEAGWPVVDKPQPDALSVTGTAEIGPPLAGKQRVKLAWTLKRPDGREVGTVSQSNDVPAGSLDSGWGETALYAAQAAAEGIAGLVQKLR